MSADRAERALLRHVVATIAYHGGKAIRDLPAGVEAFRPAPGSRSPLEILAHVNDLVDWAGKKDVLIHLYGKTEPRPGRKMGHVTRLTGRA